MTPDQEIVLNAAKRLLVHVEDGLLAITKTRWEAGREVWDIRHIPEKSNPLLDMAMAKDRQGTITVYPTVDGPLYEVKIYAGRDGLRETELGRWERIGIRDPEIQFTSSLARKIHDGVHRAWEANPDTSGQKLLISDIENAYTDRVYVVRGVNGTTRDEVSALVSLTAAKDEIEDVRFPKNAMELGL